jgi:hypothetical protein
MSYNTELQNNNLELRGILDAVNALPEAGSGGADAPIEYSEGLSYFFKDTNSYLILGYGDWDGEDLIIPPTYDDGTNGEHPVDELGYDIFGGNTKIKSATLPETIQWIGSDIFVDCPNLTHLYIPYIQQIASICMSSSSFKYVQFRNIEMIGGYDFHYCQGAEFDFTQCTSVPTLDSYGAGEEFGTDPVILVPKNLLEEWKQATNWTLYADYIVV